MANIPYTKNARNKELLEIFQLAEDLGLDELELRKIWYSQRSIRYEREKEYRKKPQKEGRDNKDVYVGSSGDNRNKIRYPSKKRSRSTWKKFYALFPRVAERDGWDGKSSKKMK